MTTLFDERDPASILNILDLAPAMVRDFAGRISFWTAGAERLYGWTAQEAVGRVSHELLATVFPKALVAIEADLLRDGFWHGPLEHRARDGQLIRVASHWALQRDAQGHPAAVAEVNTDVGPQHHAEAARMRLAAIVSSSTDAIIATALDGTVTDWNTAAGALFGYAAAEIVGRSAALLVQPEQRAEEARILTDIELGAKIAAFETIRCHKDGSAIPVAVSVSPIVDTAGAIAGTATIMRDLRARNDRERRIAELQSELRHFGRVNELGQLVAALVHELNQPLNAITNYVGGLDNLLTPDMPAGMLTAVDGIREQTVRAAAIIRRMRDFVHKGTPVRRGHDLADVIEDAIALVSVNPIAKGVRIRTRVGEDATRILADRIEIQQVLFNLLRNALEAMAGQRQRSIVLTASSTGADMIEVRVADSGPGMPEQVLANLFAPFVTTKAQGLGMGLSICHSIVEAHGGRLTVESRPGAGTAFRFTLPRERVGAGRAIPARL